MKRIKVPEAQIIPSGSWRCRVQVDGKRQQFVKDTKEEAEEAARQAVAAITAGVAEEKKKAATVGSCIDRYILDREAILSPSTIRGYKIVRKSRFQSMMGRDIHSITQQQWQAAINLEAKTCKPKTIRNSWGLISSVIKDATGAAPDVRLPAAAKNTRPFLDDQQTKTFLAAIKDTNIEAAAILALHSLRCSELLALTWGSIDCKRKIITVKGAMVPDETNTLVLRDQNKTTASQRIVPVIIPRLLELAKDQPQQDRIVQITPNWLYKSINEICEANDLPKVGIHGLRHTFASICFYNGIPEKAVMDIGGWSNPAVLREIYTHLSARQKNVYIDKLSGFFEEKS